MPLLQRSFADASKDLPKSPDGKGPTTDQLPHVSQEAAATADITGEAGPDITQGTPVNEVLASELHTLIETFS
jgi:small subunit ribosomal protein S7